MNDGDSISRYRIICLLGKGGMGVVYHAEDTRLQRPVALKFLRPDSLKPEDRDRFLNEARAAARIRHPNVCPIYDVEEADDKIFIAMAYLEGETLSRRIARGPLEIRQAVDIALQISKGLEAAHELGIVHRDIKSSNIHLGADGHASILDFGLALLPGAARLTAAGHTTGTPAYMSPEQARGQAVDQRTDIWSLGVLLFEMVAGVLPFRNANAFAVIHSIVSDQAPTVSSLRTNVPPGLEHAINKALAKPPEQRWQRASDLASSLQRIQQTLAASTGHDPHATISETETLRPTNSNGTRWYRRKGAMATFAALFLLSSSGAWFYLRHDRVRAPERSPGKAASLFPTVSSKQLAVLPFQVAGSQENVRIVADGLLEVITEALSDFERFRGKIIPVPASEIRRREISSGTEARRIYGVDLAISGSAQSQDNKIQFKLQLVDAANNQPLAGTAFEYDPLAPREAKNRAVDQVAQLLQLKPVEAARERVASAESGTADSYSAYLEGRGLLSRYDVRGNVDKSIVSFRRAVDLDPKFALAWAGLGGAYWRKARTNGDKESAMLARESAEHAVKLDPGLAIVHSVLGTIYGATGREQEAIAELQTAMQLAPGNAESPRELAQIYAKLGRLKEAEASHLKAVEARPTDWYGHLLLGLFYIEHERYKEAEAALKHSLELAPDNDLILRNLGRVYLILGRYPVALEVLQKSLKIRSNARTYLTLSATYFYQHRYQDAAAAIETAIDLDPSFYEYWGNLGIYDKRIPGAEARVEPALRRAVELAMKRLEITPTEYEIRAALAEYRARLGDPTGALAEIDRIPVTSRQAHANRIAVAYELTGNRTKAIELIRQTLTNPASLTQIRDDPDLASLWADPLFQQAVRH